MKRPQHRRPAKAAAPDERIGRVFKTRIERIVPGGYGLAHAEGETLLVALGAPGDEVEVKVRSTRGRACFAHILRIVESAPVRVAPPCPYFGRCGGCDFQQLSYDAQLAAKLDIIRDALRRTARLANIPRLDITPALRQWQYRSRVEWQHDAAAGTLGYFERGSHRVCDVTHCPVAAPELESVLEELHSAMRNGALDETEEFRAMVGDAGEVALTPPHGSRLATELRRTIRGEIYHYSANCFFQINHDLLPDMIAEALRPIEEASKVQLDFALDLYCGVGLFTVPLARRVRRVIGIESHKTSARYGILNLEAAGLTEARVETGEVKEWLARHEDDLPDIDFVLLDPPRTGAEAATVGSLIHMRPKRIAYVSCDPVTLARDLGMLVPAGYKLESLRAFDLFPQTHHVETVAHLAAL